MAPILDRTQKSSRSVGPGESSHDLAPAQNPEVGLGDMLVDNLSKGEKVWRPGAIKKGTQTKFVKHHQIQRSENEKSTTFCPWLSEFEKKIWRGVGAVLCTASITWPQRILRVNFKMNGWLLGPKKTKKLHFQSKSHQLSWNSQPFFFITLKP